MRRILASILTFALFITSAAIFSVSAADKEKVDIPEPWFDLEFDKVGRPKDAKGNAKPKIVGDAKYEKSSVIYNGKEYETMGFRPSGSDQYIELSLPFGETTDEFGQFIMKGSAFELFMQIDTPTAGSAGLFTSCYSGGFSIYHYVGSAIYAQLGTDTNANHYVYTTAKATPAADFGKIMHIVAVYNEKLNQMEIYINGMKHGTQSHSGNYVRGEAKGNLLGIGVNASELTECLSNFTTYTLLDARIYDMSLSQKQITQRYTDLIFGLTGEEPSVMVAASIKDEPDVVGDAVNVSAMTTEGVKKPYFDMVYENGELSDASGNVTLNIFGGGVHKRMLNYNGEKYPATVFTGARDGEFIEAVFNKLDGSASALEKLIRNGGSTFEMFVQIDQDVPYFAGLFNSNLQHQNIYIGCGTGLNINRSQLTYTVANPSTPDSRVTFAFSIKPMQWNEVVHLAGVYDDDLDCLLLYMNGDLVAANTYVGTFDMMGAICNKFGIGGNISTPSENVGKYSKYSVLDANLYDYALSADQVKDRHRDYVNTLTNGSYVEKTLLVLNKDNVTTGSQINLDYVDSTELIHEFSHETNLAIAAAVAVLSVISVLAGYAIFKRV